MSSKFSGYSRREFLKLGGAALGGGALSSLGYPLFKRVQQPLAKVTILKAASYGVDLYDVIRRGLQNYPNVLARVKNGRILLKPNIVDHYPNHPVNTHPVFIAAVAAAFYHFGAAEVIVGEGPGHRRDSEMLLELSDVGDALKQEKLRFVDLNLDAISKVALKSNYTGAGHMFFPNTVLGADLVVSLPKLKTHHWAGVTLSMKNMFGTVPGVKYGWPKNFLHWHGISESIVDINNTIQPGFAIIDGVEGMDGDGPLHGEVVHSGVIVMGDQLTAVDATAARIMGIHPENIDYLMHFLNFGGTINDGRIQQLGENIADVQQDFAVMPHMAFIKQPYPVLRKILLLGW